ncbi:N-acetylmuramoyl-L-alanine amidase family protein [Mariniphaga anaerophila]|uniref:N-acetylmuramoyl-L-alanine amidase family protein n=1 Tax=Mariniphaga anaerophila TaxID=1484053 RepID=UPI001C319C49|nr:N-acetylmuramoyl-L-alanine amidase [Mariniphaga anaerophila]
MAGTVNSFSLLAQPTEVVAQKGDGIYRLLTRNGLPATEYMEAFIELNKERLGPDNSLFAGRKYKLPGRKAEGTLKASKPLTKPKGPTRNIEIFGKKYAEVEIIDEQLKGAVFHLVAGHGGPDPGAVAKYGDWQLCEDEYAYDVTLRLARNLIQHGATVYMITRDKNDGIRDESYLRPDKDEVCYPNQKIPLNQIRRLRQRTDAVNDLYKKHRGSFQRMVAIHVDSRSHGENIDVFFYHDKRSKTGEKAAHILKNTFQQKYDQHQPGRGYSGTVSTRNLYVVKNTYPVAVYIELGNINHRRDQQRFIIPSNRQALANWLFEGLVEDYKTNK